MFTRAFWIVVCLTLLLGCGGEVATVTEEPEAEEPASAPVSDRGLVTASIGEAVVSIEYGRPSLNEAGEVRETGASPQDSRAGAEIGYVWRLGMNEATTLETDRNLKFGDIVVPGGQYTIFAKKTAAEAWELIFNTASGLWGAFEHDPALDVASAPLQIEESAGSVDQFTIEIRATGDDSGEIVLQWGTDLLKTAFAVE